jgi:NADPH:quinone reductase-like Zn-dependent oxidoreductase
MIQMNQAFIGYQHKKSMKAVRIHKFGGGAQDLEYEEDLAQPHPMSEEVLVKVYAAGVTLNEIVWIWESPDISLPLILGHELSGVIEEVGSEVDLRVGDAVYGLTDPTSVTRDGAEAEYVITKDSEISPKPQTLDHENAAGVPMGGLTAWQALFDHARLTSNDTILIHGAAGGVGSMAVQFARWTGAGHIIGTASTQNSGLLKDLGVHEIIDYKKTNFDDIVRDVDVVFDTVGGKTLEKSWKVIRKGGRLVSVATQLPVGYEKINEYIKGKGDAYGVSATWFIVHPDKDQLIKIAELIDSGHVKPVVDTILPLSQASQAYEGAKSNHKQGKIVLRVR